MILHFHFMYGSQLYTIWGFYLLCVLNTNSGYTMCSHLRPVTEGPNLGDLDPI